MTRVLRLAACILAVAGSACGDEPTAPTDPAATPTTLTRLFEGTITTGGSAFFSFTVTESGTLSATLASLTVVGRPTALAVPVQLGVGIPAGQGCALTQSADALPGLIPQFTASLAPGIYCLSIVDTARTLSPQAQTVFAIRFTHT